MYADSEIPHGTPKLGAVLHLPAHHQPIGLLEQAADRRAHHQRRHQVLEHRARPRNQRRAAIDRRHRAPQPEPVPRRNLALGDRDETRQPRFRREQVVTIGIETPVGDAIADRKQLARGIEQEVELHRVEHLARSRGEFRQMRRSSALAAAPARASDDLSSSSVDSPHHCIESRQIAKLRDRSAVERRR